METEKKRRDYLLPGSILIAALLVALALVYSAGRTGGGQLAGSLKEAAPQQPAPENVRPVASDDHILGSKDAPVKIIVFSDLECPFCKEFHQTVKQAFGAYQGKVAFVYRHFPIDELHSRARGEAVASECAADLGGESKFWAYVDRIFEITPSNNGLDPAKLSEIAEYVGLDRRAFEACLAENRHAERVARDVRDAENSGGRGIPYSVVLTPSGKTYTIPGAYPFEDSRTGYPSVKGLLDFVFENVTSTPPQK